MGTTLNIAAGKLKPIDLEDNYFLINLDKMYYSFTGIPDIERLHSQLRNRNETAEIYCKEDAFSFMERTYITFDRITCYRFLEHVDKDKVLYFIYLMSTCLNVGGEVDIIVPDYQLLSNMILNEVPGEKDWEAHDILVTTEVVNHPLDPHASIWTQDRLDYFFELEGRFETVSNEHIEFDGRRIYIRYKAKRIK